jgi:hypothetical protein
MLFEHRGVSRDIESELSWAAASDAMNNIKNLILALLSRDLPCERLDRDWPSELELVTPIGDALKPLEAE